MRVLSGAQVRALLPMADCIEAMEEVLRTMARGEVRNPLRNLLRFPDGSGLLGLMPAWLGSPECAGIKVVTVMPGNHGTPFDAHQGAVLLFETGHGRLQGVIDGSAVTALRTAAVSGVATRALARKKPCRLAVLGSGVQAAAHLEAMLAVREVSEVRVHARSPEGTRVFAARQEARFGVPVRASASAREAVEGVEVICTTTSSRSPVLMGTWVSPGTHINAVGACFPAARELDTDCVRKSTLFVDSRESAKREAGDFLIPLAEGAFGEDHIRAELGEVLLGTHPGRTGEEEITLFKSLGLGVEDLGAAHLLLRIAERDGLGTEVELGGLRDPG
jgi:ornithine cyclodeaminase